ncbi:MAG: 4'-phosphopantetheinyl transferase superfamily protein [Proteobacteria bacterium]|nr:4'-phosphopantetheinyl transferase superfamily protein [Pseudomonadota bacterium]NOG59491.1 4'-phosphopantetheinyl transferase superfamily protein [Pseudomonadota bacterium]
MNRNNQFFQDKIKLSDQEIHVLLLQLDSFECDDLMFCLSDDERERANRLKIEEKKKQFIIVRSALRQMLSGLSGMTADKILFSYGEHKKPYIEYLHNDQPVEFNVSHSGNYALIAVTLGCKIGVDIEMINDQIDYRSLSERFFSVKENEEFSKIDIGQQLETFYRVWARKESFIKADGKGVAFGLDRFTVSLSDNSRTKIEFTDSQLTNEQWHCYNLMDIENYKTALTCCGKEKKIIFCQ